METVAQLARRGVLRIQHTSWNEGQYLRLNLVDHATPMGNEKRCAPTAVSFVAGQPPDPSYSVYDHLTFEADPEWRQYNGKLDPKDA